MERVVIYGAGNAGKSAYFYLKSRYECLFFVDGDSKKWGQEFEGLQIREPDALKQIGNVKVVVASIYWKEILDEIRGFGRMVIEIYKPETEVILSDGIKEELNKRTVNLGSFLRKQKRILCKELAFMPGGSQVLDYVFLKAVGSVFQCKKYLEIGTYIGESINIMTECCEELYSVTAPLESPLAGGEWCKELGIPNHSGRLAYDERITHYYADSRIFNFENVGMDIDLFFIDGDHSYEGVYSDTKKIFEVKKADAIVIWHDFRNLDTSYRAEVVNAVRDALQDEFRNVYATNNNLCGIYLPEKYKEEFELREIKYEEKAPLYTYDCTLDNCKVFEA